MNKFHGKKKAFTLTELLVVVIVIGVLSAVVLPKFNKVLETRKTTEAEELMASVRTEQEKRCALDKNYLMNLADVKDMLPGGNSKNFSYSLTPTGMDASSVGKYGYKLSMPSYKDGRICCENEAECAKLNKDYPLCSTLVARADYQNGHECAGEPPVFECPGNASEACGCLGKGNKTRTCNTSTGVWSAWSACSIPDACECTGTKPADSQACNGCGTQTRSVTCNASNGQWSAGTFSSCSKTAEDCAPKCADGEIRNSSTTCYNGCGVVVEQCQGGVWRGINCVMKPGAECPMGYEQKTKCEDGVNFSIKTCNSSCKFEETQACPALGCSSASYRAAHKAECCPSFPVSDTVCYKLGALHWSTLNSNTDNQAIFRCNQTNMYDPGRQCSGICSGKTQTSNSSCSSLSGSCSSKGEVCMLQQTYCPVFSGSYTYGTPNCNCKGGEVLNKTYKECIQSYEHNGW